MALATMGAEAQRKRTERASRKQEEAEVQVQAEAGDAAAASLLAEIQEQTVQTRAKKAGYARGWRWKQVWLRISI